jgi:hypothetical protein
VREQESVHEVIRPPQVPLEEDYLWKDKLKVTYTDALEEEDLDNMRGFVKALDAKRKEQEKLHSQFTRPVRN